jgi:hypothetical protein
MIGIWLGSKTYGSNSRTMAVSEHSDTRQGSRHTGNSKERGYSERDRGTAGDRRRWSLRRGLMNDESKLGGLGQYFGGTGTILAGSN